MNILFLTLVKIDSYKERGIYHDLLRQFVNDGHQVHVVCPTERREGKNTHLVVDGNFKVLNVRTFNLQKTGVIEKGIGTLFIEYQYLYAIKKFFSDIKFDLVLYSTPPITFSKVISYIKKKDNSYSYLLLKDIFPQNAVDIGLMKKDSFIHKMFKNKEKKLYQISDAIGCMSDANLQYLLTNNPYISPPKVEVNPNSIELKNFQINNVIKEDIRKKYGLPLDKVIFVYGGNLGRPQGIDFLLEILESKNHDDAFFLIVGTGTEYPKIEKWFQHNKPVNAKLLPGIPKNDYDILLSSCDVGLILLHKNFTIPNFPSRLLSYLEMKLPIIAATDAATDIGDVITNANCGFKIISGDIEALKNAVNLLCENEKLRESMSQNAYKLLTEKYQVEHSYQLIIEKLHNNVP